MNSGRRLYATMQRNASKMGARLLATTNAWVPGDESVAEQIEDTASKRPGIMVFGPQFEAHVEDIGDVEQLRAGVALTYRDAPWVDQVRIVQCDTTVSADDFVAPEALAQYQVTGYGGSDLSPALLHLAEDPQTRAVVAITDGDVAAFVEPVEPETGLFQLVEHPGEVDRTYQRHDLERPGGGFGQHAGVGRRVAFGDHDAGQRGGCRGGRRAAARRAGPVSSAPRGRRRWHRCPQW